MQSKKIVILATIFTFLFAVKSYADDKDCAEVKNVEDSSAIKISGYVDAYYAYYTDSVGDGNFQKFPSVSPRSNQFGLNTAHLNLQYDAEKIRALVVLHYGDIPVSAWSGTFNTIMEAHAGVRLCKRLWLDAGFFRTHIGAEGLLPVENFTSSVSVSTFYEPYFESGFRLNFIPDDKWSINLLALNGYNIYEDNNQNKSFGVLATFAMNDKGNIGYSNYVGDDTPTAADSISHLRVFQNIFFNYQIKKLKMQIGIDEIMQEHSAIKDTTKSATMMSGVVSFKYLFTDRFSLYTRGELCNDPQGFMTGVIADKTNKQTGLKLWGVTFGGEYKPAHNAIIRLEARQLTMEKNQKIFRWNHENKNTRFEILFNIGVSF